MNNRPEYEHIHFNNDDCMLILNAIHGYLSVFAKVSQSGNDFNSAEIERAKDLTEIGKQIEQGGRFMMNFVHAKHIVFAMQITKPAFIKGGMSGDDLAEYKHTEAVMALCAIMSGNDKQKLDFVTNMLDGNTEQL